MGDFLIRDDGDGFDFVIEDGDLVRVGETETDDAAAVGQRITYTLYTWLGESPYATEQGIDYDGVFADEPTPGIAQLLIQRIANVEGVAGFDEQPTFQLDTLTRELFVTGAVVTAAGQPLRIEQRLSA